VGGTLFLEPIHQEYRIGLGSKSFRTVLDWFVRVLPCLFYQNQPIAILQIRRKPIHWSKGQPMKMSEILVRTNQRMTAIVFVMMRSDHVQFFEFNFSCWAEQHKMLRLFAKNLRGAKAGVRHSTPRRRCHVSPVRGLVFFFFFLVCIFFSDITFLQFYFILFFFLIDVYIFSYIYFATFFFFFF